MTPKMKREIAETAKKLREMPEAEFRKLLREHEDGEYARILREIHYDFQSLSQTPK